MKIKEDELLYHIEMLSNDTNTTYTNCEKLLKSKNSTIFELEGVNDDLEKECEAYTN